MACLVLSALNSDSTFPGVGRSQEFLLGRGAKYFRGVKITASSITLPDHRAVYNARGELRGQWRGVGYDIHPSIHGLSGRWCPLSPHFLTGSVFMLSGLALVFWAFASVGVHRLALRLPYLGVVPFTLHLPLNFIRVSSLRPMYLHPFGRPFTYSLSK